MLKSKLYLRNTIEQDYTSKQFIENIIGEDLLTKTMLARRLNFSVSYINKLMKQKKIPYIKGPKSVRFKYSDVVAALQKGSAV